MTTEVIEHGLELERIYRRMKANRHPAAVGLQAKKRFVPGEGSLTPRFVLVGEAPGRTENATGKPFIGAAGEVLNGMLRAARLRRDHDVFITNVVKYWPTVINSDLLATRRPSLGEMLAFRPWLIKELKALNCPRIILLGVTAQQVFWPAGKIAAPERGEWAKLPDLPFRAVMLYHPAVGCYQPSKRPQLYAEFRKAVEDAG